MSISWEPPVGPGDSGFVIFFADLLPGDDGFEELPCEPVCLHCLLEDADEDLGRGMDLAKRHGQVDWDVDAGVWRVPDAFERQHGLRRRGER